MTGVQTCALPIYLWLPGVTGNPGISGYLCWLGLPVMLPGATWCYQVARDILASGDIYAGRGYLVLPGATWGYRVAREILASGDIYAGWGYLLCYVVPPGGTRGHGTSWQQGMSMLAGATRCYLVLPGTTGWNGKA